MVDHEAEKGDVPLTFKSALKTAGQRSVCEMTDGSQRSKKISFKITVKPKVKEPRLVDLKPCLIQLGGC